MEDLLLKVGQFFLEWGYLGILIVLFLEASIFPIPSEIVLLPAGYMIATGKMDIFFVLGAGVLGSILGSSLNYALGYVYGREFLIKYGRKIGLTEDRLKKIEVLFLKRGELTIVIARLFPLLRQYISFPAGVVKMKLYKFIIYTGIGYLLYIGYIVFMGYLYKVNEKFLNRYIIKFKYLVIIIIVIYLSYKIYQIRYVKKRK